MADAPPDRPASTRLPGAALRRPDEPDPAVPPEPTWFLVIPPAGWGAAWELTGSGIVRLSGGPDIAAGGWIRHGGSLVHRGGGLELSLATGELRAAAPDVVAGWPVDGDPLVVWGDVLGLYVGPAVGAAGAEFVPMRMRPRAGVLDRVDAWSAQLSPAQQDLVTRAGLQAQGSAGPMSAADLAAHRQEAEEAAEWRLRHESALDGYFPDRPRTLPPGLAEWDPVSGNREFAFGHHGRLLWAGTAGLTAPGAIAHAVEAALPDGLRTRLGAAVRAEVVRQLTRYDPRLFVQAMIEGHAPVRVVVAKRTYDIKVGLTLGDLNRAAYVPPADAERVIPGQEWHVLVNADHEVQSLARRSVSNTRRFGLSAGSPAVKPVADKLELTGAVALAGTSGVSYGQGFDAVSATKRYLEVTGMPVYFDFADARLTTQVTGPAGVVTNGATAGRVRAEFPRELAPLAVDGVAGVRPEESLGREVAELLGVANTLAEALHDRAVEQGLRQTELEDARSLLAERQSDALSDEGRLTEAAVAAGIAWSLTASAPDGLANRVAGAASERRADVTAVRAAADTLDRLTGALGSARADLLAVEREVARQQGEVMARAQQDLHQARGLVRDAVTAWAQRYAAVLRRVGPGVGENVRAAAANGGDLAALLRPALAATTGEPPQAVLIDDTPMAWSTAVAATIAALPSVAGVLDAQRGVGAVEGTIAGLQERLPGLMTAVTLAGGKVTEARDALTELERQRRVTAGGLDDVNAAVDRFSTRADELRNSRDRVGQAQAGVAGAGGRLATAQQLTRRTQTQVQDARSTHDERSALLDRVRNPLGGRLIGVAGRDYLAARANPLPTPHDTTVLHQALATERVLSHVFTIPESAPGLNRLRTRVQQVLTGGTTPLSADASAEVAWWVSEPAFLRMWGDITGPGAISPLIVSGRRGRYGSHVTTRAVLLNAQALTEDPVAMKEESQRFASDHNDVSDSGGFAPEMKGKVKGVFGGDSGVGGKKGRLLAGGLSAEGVLGAGHSASRALHPNRGSGEVRGLVYNSDSVRFRLTMYVSADVVSNLPGVAPSTTVGELTTVYIRVPQRQRARFEAMLDLALASPQLLAHPTGVAGTGTGLVLAGGVADRDVIPTDPVKATAQSQAEAQVRYPPAQVQAKRSIGFSAVERLAGAERVLPTVLRQLAEAENELGLAARTPVELAGIARRFSSKLTKESLINFGTQLFNGGQVTVRETLPYKYGKQHVIAKVTPTRDDQPFASGRVEKAKLELMPAGFAGVGGEDKLTSNWSLGANVGANFTIKKAHLDLGVGGKAGYASNRDASGGVSAGGFQLQAMLYEGPARTFDYNADLDVTLDVVLELRRWTRFKQFFGRGWAWVRRRNAQRPQTTAQRQTAIQNVSTRFVMPEAMAPTQQPDNLEVARTGQVTTTPINRNSQLTTRDLLRAADGGYTPLTADDLLTEVLGAPDLGTRINAILTRRGLGQLDAAELTGWAVDVTQLEGMQIRGPSTSQPSIVVKGTMADRHVDVTLESFVVNARATGQPFEFLKMDVAEGGPNVSAGKQKSWSWSWGFSLSPFFSIGSGGISLPSGWGWGQARRRGKGSGLGPQTGRLTQVKQPYQEYVGDVIWRVTVNPRKKNLWGSFGRRLDGEFVQINDGIRFLRPVTAAARPPAPPLPAPAESAVVEPAVSESAVVESAVAEPEAAEIQTAPVPPAPVPPAPIGTGALPATLARIPVGAATEVLIARPAVPAPPIELNPTGEANVLMDVVGQLLAGGAKGLLKRKWTIDGDKDLPPDRLSTILNSGSATAMVDQLLGTGVVLVLSRSRPLWHKRTHIVLRAERDPDNLGYTLAEELSEVNVTRYTFRLNTESTSAGRGVNHEKGIGISGKLSPVFSWLASLTGSFGVKQTRGRSEGHGLTTTDAARDTFFLPGRAGRYYGDVRISGELVTVSRPSRLLNTLLLDLPRWLARGADRLRKPTTASGRMWERVLVPQDLATGAAGPRLSGAAAVTELAIGTGAASLGARPLPVSREDIVNRRVFTAGFDPVTLNALAEQVVTRLRRGAFDVLAERMRGWRTGTGRPINTSTSVTVSRLAAMGTRSRDAIMQMFSFPMFSRQLEFMVDNEGLTSPRLVADGGPFTDTHGETNVRVELVDARVGDYLSGWLEWSNYGFTEHKQELGGSQGAGQDVSTTAALAAGVAVTGAMSLGQSSAQTGIGIMKSMWPTTGQLRKAAWLQVRADAIVHVTVKASNRRGQLKYPGGTVRMAFRVRDAVDLVLSPEASLEWGLWHAHGVPTPAGYYMPSNRVATDRTATAAAHRAEQLHAAYSFPPVQDAVVVHVATHRDGANNLVFEVNDRGLTAAEYHDQVLRHLSLTGKTLVLVGSQIAAPGPNGTASAAAQIAQLATVSVVAAQTTAHTTSDGHVLAASTRTTAHNQMLLSDRGAWVLTRPDRSTRRLDIDLADSLRRAGLTVSTPDKPILPPTQPHNWGTAVGRPERLTTNGLVGDQDGSGSAGLRLWLAADDLALSRQLFSAFGEEILGEAAALRDLVAQHPLDDRLATRSALVTLARAGMADLGYDYLSQPDPGARRAILFRAFTPGNAGLLDALADLTRQTAIRPDEVADIAAVRAVAAALRSDGRVPSMVQVKTVRAAVETATRVSFVKRLAEFELAFPSHQAALRQVAATLVDCL